MILSPYSKRKKMVLVINFKGIKVTVIAARPLHYVFNQQPLSHLGFRREITICFMKTPSGFTLLRQPCLRSTFDLPVNIGFDGNDHTKVLITQGRCKICQRNVIYICSKCGFCLHCVRVLYVLICTILTNDLKFFS